MIKILNGSTEGDEEISVRLNIEEMLLIVGEGSNNSGEGSCKGVSGNDG